MRRNLLFAMSLAVIVLAVLVSRLAPADDPGASARVSLKPGPVQVIDISNPLVVDAQLDIGRQAYVAKLHAIEESHPECGWFNIAPGPEPHYLGCERLAATAPFWTRARFWWDGLWRERPDVAPVPVIVRPVN